MAERWQRCHRDLLSKRHIIPSSQPSFDKEGEKRNVLCSAPEDFISLYVNYFMSEYEFI